MTSTHANCAKMIRQDLKKAFPNNKFSVTSEIYSMGSSVRINWVDGVTSKQVESIVDKYQYGHFDGMKDLYENSNSRDDIPQVKYVTTHRELSNEIVFQCSKVAKSHYHDLETIKEPQTIEDLSISFKFADNFYNWYQLALRILSQIDLTNAQGIKQDKNFTGGSLFSGFLAMVVQ
jgi:hypothetical protein